MAHSAIPGNAQFIRGCHICAEPSEHTVAVEQTGQWLSVKCLEGTQRGLCDATSVREIGAIQVRCCTSLQEQVFWKSALEELLRATVNTDLQLDAAGRAHCIQRSRQH